MTLSLATHVRIAGGLQMALSLLHVAFPARFEWKRELPRLSPLNRQMFLAHYFFIALTVMLFGVLSAFFALALLSGGALGPVILGGITLFWLLRALAQFFFYDAALWRGIPLHTAVHIGFSLLWLYLTGVYGWALAAGLGWRPQ